jgi:hypothetical protein
MLILLRFLLCACVTILIAILYRHPPILMPDLDPLRRNDLDWCRYGDDLLLLSLD